MRDAIWEDILAHHCRPGSVTWAARDADRELCIVPSPTNHPLPQVADLRYSCGARAVIFELLVIRCREIEFLIGEDDPESLVFGKSFGNQGVIIGALHSGQTLRGFGFGHVVEGAID